MRNGIYWLLFITTTLQAFWEEESDKAFAKARETKSSLVVVFLGSEWCPWSEKVEREILSDPLFQEELGKGVMGLKVNISSEDVGALGREFNISGVPTFLLLDENQVEVARQGFLPQPPKEFGAYLASLYDKYHSLQKTAAEKSVQEMAPEELQRFYLFAAAQGFEKFKKVFFEEGLKRNKGTFFLLEQYRALFSEHKEEAKKVRSEILKRDPKNEEGSLMHLAVCDFLQRQQGIYPPEKVVKPLKKYLKKYGGQLPDHAWRLEMMISQHFYHRGKVKQARKSAEKALKNAPIEAQEEIQEWMKGLGEGV